MLPQPAPGARAARGNSRPARRNPPVPKISVWGMRERPQTEQELGVIDLHNADERPDSRFLILPRIIPALPGNPRARAEAQRFPGLQQDQNPLGSACSLQHPHHVPGGVPFVRAGVPSERFIRSAEVSARAGCDPRGFSACCFDSRGHRRSTQRAMTNVFN